jgi:predicted aminopeptidase
MKRWFAGVGFSLLILILIYHNLIIYGIRQATGQFKIIWNAEPVEQFLQNPDFPDSLKFKLRLIQDVRKYAVDSLGINDTDNYTTMYDQQGEPVLWVVTASKPFSLEAKQWTFPLIGTFSYKGFFKYDLALKEASNLKRKGLDTGIRSVGGWSTLGWFNDPILSEMLNREEGQLAELIIHELTHATLFVKDSVEFNENLATFIGEKGAVKFLSDHYGKDSQELLEYQISESDRNLYVSYILQATQQLNTLYTSFTNEMDSVTKQSLKINFMEAFIENMDTVSFRQPEKYKRIFKDNLPNNTFFMSYLRYHAKGNVLENIFRQEFDCDLKAFLQYLKNKYPSL